MWTKFITDLGQYLSTQDKIGSTTVWKSECSLEILKKPISFTCIITCPHSQKNDTCDQQNDPLAFQHSLNLHRKICGFGIHSILLQGHANRRDCDLNRKECVSTFGKDLELLLSQYEKHGCVVLDIHGFLVGVNDWGGEDNIVCLTPEEGSHHEQFLKVLKTSKINVTVLNGGKNFVINSATKHNIPTLLIEIPYKSNGNCEFTIPPKLYNVVEELATVVKRYKELEDT